MNKFHLIINPIVFMLIGTSYYFISPVVFFFNDYFNLSFLNSVMSDFISGSSSAIYTHSIVDFFIINFFFIIGYTASLTLKSKVNYAMNYNNYKLLPFFVLVLIFIVFSGVIFKAISSGFVFFSGYSTYNIAILGPLATICFMSMWFYIFFNKKYFLFLYFLVGILLLGAGSRMFFVLPFISLVIYNIEKKGKIQNRYVLFALLFVIFVLFIGLWRQGSDFSIDGLLNILFAEPIFTSLSSLFYFQQGFPIISFPYDILASFVNFIPSFLFSNKIEYMSMLTYDPKIYNPLGAQSLLVNLYKNFGYGYPVFIFFLGYYFGFLYKNKGNRLFFTIYILSLPVILLHFQREGFITVFKVLFFNGVFLPTMIIYALGSLLKRS